MITTVKTIGGLCAIALLTACGGTSGGMIDEPPVNDAQPTTFTSRAEVQSQRDFINAGFGLDETGPIAGVRNGTATYEGRWATGFIVDGEPEIDAIFGDVTMQIDVGGGSYAVDGTISDLNTVSGNQGLEALDGTLDIDGSIGGLSKDFNGTTFEGDVSGYFGGDNERTLTIDANVSGGMRNRNGFGNNGSTVTGRTSGTASFDDGGGVDITTGQFRADRNN